MPNERSASRWGRVCDVVRVVKSAPVHPGFWILLRRHWALGRQCVAVVASRLAYSQLKHERQSRLGRDCFQSIELKQPGDHRKKLWLSVWDRCEDMLVQMAICTPPTYYPGQDLTIGSGLPAPSADRTNSRELAARRSPVRGERAPTPPCASRSQNSGRGGWPRSRSPA